MNETNDGRRRINWWMVGFFIAILAFELQREAYVSEVKEPAGALRRAIMPLDDGVLVEGQWNRSDGGSPIVQGGLLIRCFKQWNSCIEVNTIFMPEGKFVYTFIDVHDIDSMTDGEVTYSNLTDCANYRVRIDIAADRAFATRDKPENAPSSCENLESRVAMELGDNMSRKLDYDSWLEGEFLPIHDLVRAIFR